MARDPHPQALGYRLWAMGALSITRPTAEECQPARTETGNQGRAHAPGRAPKAHSLKPIAGPSRAFE